MLISLPYDIYKSFTQGYYLNGGIAVYLYWKEFRRAHFICVPNCVSWHIYRGWDEYGYSRLVLSIGSEKHILDDGEDLMTQYSGLSEYAIGGYHSAVVTSIANSLPL